MTYIYHNRKLNLFALFVLGLTFIMAIVRARRGLAFLSFFPILASYAFYLFYSKNTLLKVIFMLALVITIPWALPIPNLFSAILDKKVQLVGLLIELPRTQEVKWKNIFIRT